MGNTALKNLKLNVLYKPVIDPGSSSKVVGSWDDNEIELKCLASGLPSPDFQWFTPGGHPVTQATSKIHNGETLTVTTTDSGDYGEYKCVATNVVGTANYFIFVRKWDKPSEPSSVTVKVREASYVKLTWTAPSDDGGSPVIDYWLKIENNQDPTDTKELNYVTGTEKLVDQLNPGETYSVWLRARNIVGYGDFASTSFTTKIPSGLLVLLNKEKSISSRQVTLKWSYTSATNDRIISYTIWKREVRECGSPGGWDKQKTSGDITSYTVTGLEWCKTYQFGITANSKSGKSKLYLSNLKKIKIVPSDNNDQSSDFKEAVYGTFIGVLLLINLLQLIYIIKMKRNRIAKNNERTERLVRDARNEHECYTNPIVNEMSANTSSSSATADYMPLVPMTRSWEVPPDSITIVKVIGKGAFGQVAEAKKGDKLVAVKMLKENARETDRKDLLSELELMKRMKPHPHVIKLLGCVTENDPLMVIIEYVPHGDLLGYLRKSRGLNDTYYKDPDIKPKTTITSQQLIKFAWQVADGMAYLSARKIIHRDLAARNVLVGEGETCKVTDFGMARDVQQEDIYTKTSKGRLPVKWTAFESLMYGKYTTQSDVWSFGILLYELFTIGGCPYPKLNGHKIAQMLQEGYRMPKPDHVDQRLYQLMLDCWQENPDARPVFVSLKKVLKEMERNQVMYVNLKKYNSGLYANLEDLHGDI